MRITDAMLVPDDTPDDDAIVRTCKVVSEKTWHVPQKVKVMSAGGMRTMRLWVCEDHPLPEFITDDPNSEA